MSTTVNFPSGPKITPNQVVAPSAPLNNTPGETQVGGISSSVGNSLFSADRFPLTPLPVASQAPQTQGVDGTWTALESDASFQANSVVADAADQGGEIRSDTAYKYSLATARVDELQRSDGPSTRSQENSLWTASMAKDRLSSELAYQQQSTIKPAAGTPAPGAQAPSDSSTQPA